MKSAADVVAQERDLLAVFDEVRHAHQMLKVKGLGHRSQGTGGSNSWRTYALSEWSDVLVYHPADMVVTVGAGMTLSQLNRILAEYGQWIPLSPPDGQDDTVGGAVAAGLDGIWRGGYGPFRDRVLGLRVLTPGFGAIGVGGAVVKNVAGYNLPRLFFGSHGALGVITQITLKLSPRPQSQWYWAWEGNLDEMVEKAHELMNWAAPWASIAFVADPHNNDIRLWAAWHGVSETIDYLVETKEAGAAHLPLLTRPWEPGPVTLKGAIPRRLIKDLIRGWEEGQLVVEWQSGGFWGTVSEGNAGRITNWIRESSGGVSVVSGDGDLTMPFSLTPTWNRLKEAYDPHALLG